MEHPYILASLFFLMAVIYSAVGHAGASGYLAVMALMAVPPSMMKPTALVLNILVASIATVRWYRAKYFSWNILWPFLITSIPFAFIGGALKLHARSFNLFLALVLFLAASQLVISKVATKQVTLKPLPIFAALGWGATIGFLSGMTGTGGGIFLSPLLVLMCWANTRTSSGVSAAFILCNSLAGLAGNLTSIHALPSSIGLWMATVAIGGFVGSGLGRWMNPRFWRVGLAITLVIAGLKLMIS